MSSLLTPWLSQLSPSRPQHVLDADATCDVVIVGAGIAGLCTAYEVLTQTSLRVGLVEAGRVAHGATGRNAGQVVSYFERPLAELVAEYGLSSVVQGQHAVLAAWDRLEVILQRTKVPVPLYRCTGHAGLSTLEQVLLHLESNRVRHEAGLGFEPLVVRADPHLRAAIGPSYAPFVAELPHARILQMLQTQDERYLGALSSPKGCLNSALLCTELLTWLLASFGDRFLVAEHLPVRVVRLGERGVTLLTDGPTLEAGQVVLCTNGFNMLELRNEVGPDIVTADHALVHGVIGYMGGYLRDAEAKASAISYFGPTRSHLDAYAYVTRRPFERSRRGPRELLCVGGPERPLPSCAGYDAHTAFPGGIAEEMDRFLMDTVVDAQQSERAFLWHGLMGYTPSGVRCIGAEPKNPILLYNLGCNGVGILPSVYGGQRIAQLIAGLRLPASMFDPVA